MRAQMSQDIGPGTRVQCIDDDWYVEGREMPPNSKCPIKGCLYTVRECRVMNEENYITVQEIINPIIYPPYLSEVHFHVRCFRPIWDIGKDEVEKIKNSITIGKKEYV